MRLPPRLIALTTVARASETKRHGLAARLAVMVAALALVPAGTAWGAQAVVRSGLPGARGGRALAAGFTSTLAGGAGGPANANRVGISVPCSVSFGGGYLYVGDSSTVRRVSPQTDWLTTPAGTGSARPLGDGGLAVRASLNHACGIAVDHSGNLVIADTSDNRVRVVATATGTFYGQAMSAGHIYTVAGDGSRGFSGDGGPATSAAVNIPQGVAVDGAGNLVIADTGNNRIRVVATRTGTFYGQAMTAGHIYTVAGDGSRGFYGDGGPAASAMLFLPFRVTIDGAGNLVIADTSNERIRVVAASTGRFYGRAMTAGDIYTVAGDGRQGFSGEGGPATSADLDGPADVTADPAGNLVIADWGNMRVRVVAASTGRFYGQAMTAGHIYTVAGDGTPAFSGDGGPATSAGLNNPYAVTFDGARNLVIADEGDDTVRVVAASTGRFYGQAMTAGHIYTVAGRWGDNGDLATSADELPGPTGVAADSAGVITSTGSVGGGSVRMVPAGTGRFYGQAMTAGHIYTVAGGGTHGLGDGRLAVRAELSGPMGVTADGEGNLVIADTGHYRVRVVAAATGTFYGQAMTAGHIYTVAGDGKLGFSGDGGPATSAALRFPGWVTVDSAGSLVIADTGNQRVRVVATRTGTFYGQAMTAGHIYTVAGDGTPGFSGDGGPAISAELNLPDGVAMDAAGNLVIAEYGNNRARVVAARTGMFYGQAMTAGHIYTVAGDGTPGFSGDGGPATSARLNNPRGVAVDGAGNLVIGDYGNNRVRVVAAATGRFYGQAMTAGDIYTVAGDGRQGFTGDGGPATSAQFDDPAGVAVDHAGNLVIADTGNNRIRTVTG